MNVLTDETESPEGLAGCFLIDRAFLLKIGFDSGNTSRVSRVAPVLEAAPGPEPTTVLEAAIPSSLAPDCVLVERGSPEGRILGSDVVE